MNVDISKFCRDWATGLSVVTLLTLLPSVGSTAENLQLNDYTGKVVVLDFWASWCVPCRRSFPWMSEMQQKYADKGLIIIAVNLDNDSVLAATFLQEHPAKFRIVYDTDKALAREYDVQAMPTSYLIGRDGEIADMHLGFKVEEKNEYEAAILEALDQN